LDTKRQRQRGQSQRINDNTLGMPRMQLLLKNERRTKTMKIYERTDVYLNDIRKKIKRCPKCGWDIQTTKIEGKSFPELECHICGLIIETTSRKNRLIGFVFMAGILAGMVGFVVGQIL